MKTYLLALFAQLAIVVFLAQTADAFEDDSSCRRSLVVNTVPVMPRLEQIALCIERNELSPFEAVARLLSARRSDDAMTLVVSLDLEGNLRGAKPSQEFGDATLFLLASQNGAVELLSYFLPKDESLMSSVGEGTTSPLGAAVAGQSLASLTYLLPLSETDQIQNALVQASVTRCSGAALILNSGLVDRLAESNWSEIAGNLTQFCGVGELELLIEHQSLDTKGIDSLTPILVERVLLHRSGVQMEVLWSYWQGKGIRPKQYLCKLSEREIGNLNEVVNRVATRIITDVRSSC